MSNLPKTKAPPMTAEENVIDQRLILLRHHWKHKPGPVPWKASRKKHRQQQLSIAISREVGARGSEVAQEVGSRLDWPVYDREILDLIAERSVLRAELLDSIDEQDRSWLVETLTSLGHPGEISSAGYFHHLTSVLAALGSHGKCVIVGRAATALLPLATTLRVRVIAPFEQRVQRIMHDRNLSYRDARKHTRDIDSERTRFMASHFQQDINDSLGFDLILNTARFTPTECADFVVNAVTSVSSNYKFWVTRANQLRTPDHA